MKQKLKDSTPAFLTPALEKKFRMRELRGFIKSITIERRGLLNKQRRFRIELEELRRSKDGK